MKRSIVLLNGSWFLVAAGTFALGINLSKDSSQSSGEVAGPSASSANSTILGGDTKDGSSNALAVPKELAALLDSQASWVTMEKLSSFAMGRAVEDLILETDPVKRNFQFSLLMQKLSPENAEAAFTTMREKSTGWDMRRNLGLLAYAWGTVDAPKAIEKFNEMSGREGGWMKGSVVSGWASKDASAAIAWVEGIESKEERGGYTWGLISGLSQTDIGQATNYISKMEDSGQRNRYIGMVAEQKLKEGVPSATAWVESLDDNGMKAGALDNVARNYANRDLAAATNWVEQFAATEYGDRAVSEVAESYAEKEPVPAADWAEQLPDGKARNDAFSEVFKEWARKDATSASERLAAMSDSPAKDNAVSALTREIAKDDPEGAIAWAETIQDEEMRVASLIRGGQGLYRQDPDSALAWAEEALPADQVDKIKRSENERRWSWPR